MTFVRSAGALAWRRCALRSFSPSLALPSLCDLRQRARVSPYLACACLRVRAYHLPFLCPRACGLCVWWRWCVLPSSVWLLSSGFVVSWFHTITSFRLGCLLGTPSYHSCSVSRCWRPSALCVFFDGVHLFLGAGSLSALAAFVGPLRVRVYILLFVCPWVLWYVCLWWRWCALWRRVVPSFRFRAGVPHTMLLSVRAA